MVKRKTQFGEKKLQKSKEKLQRMKKDMPSYTCLFNAQGWELHHQQGCLKHYDGPMCVYKS